MTGETPPRPLSGLDERLRRLAPPRVGPFRAGAFRPRHQAERSAAWLGISLGVAVVVCFVTGLLSHAIQTPPAWFSWPTRPVWLYRVTQGVHVATGIAAIPLLLAKLYVVYPRFWTWPPFRSSGHLVERISLVPLVGGSLFMLFTGIGSISRLRPWDFSFPAAHYAAAWITIGALVVHVGAKIHVAARALARDQAGVMRQPASPGAGLHRRAFLGGAAVAAGAVTVATVGQTVRPLAEVSVLAPRDPRVGPQGLPVNRTARSAGVVELAMDADYRLRVRGNVVTPLELSLEDLRALPWSEAVLPITCVDGWSATARWGGVAVRDLLALAGAPERGEAEIVSLQEPGTAYASSQLDASHAADPETLLALEIDGMPLDIDHGFPVRLIAPSRPGVMQTKWVTEVVVR